MVIPPVAEHLKPNKESKHEHHADADIYQIVLIILWRRLGMDHNPPIALLVNVWTAEWVANGTPGHTGGIVVLVFVRRVTLASSTAGPLRNITSHHDVLPAMKSTASSSVISPSVTHTATF